MIGHYRRECGDGQCDLITTIISGTAKGGTNMAGTSAARVDFRTTPDQKSMIERAAAIIGMTLSEFIKVTMIEKSQEVIERNEARVLSDRDRDRFLSLLEAPSAPNAALRSAASNFRNAVEDGSLKL